MWGFKGCAPQPTCMREGDGCGAGVAVSPATRLGPGLTTCAGRVVLVEVPAGALVPVAVAVV